VGNKNECYSADLTYSVTTYGMVLKYQTLYVFTKEKAYTLTTTNLESSITKEYLAEIQAFFTGFKIK